MAPVVGGGDNLPTDLEIGSNDPVMPASGGEMTTLHEESSPDRNGAAEERKPAEGAGHLALTRKVAAEPKKDRYDESKPSARMVVVLGLFWTGLDGGLLNFREPETALVAGTYTVALITAVIANLVALRSPRDDDGEAAIQAAGATTWHEPQIFSDPWYQVPAAYCVVLGVARFGLDMAEKPPGTGLEVWFLTTMLLGFALILNRQLTTRPDGADPAETRRERPARDHDSPETGILRDPWFVFPSLAVGFLHLARSGLEELAEAPDSPFARFWLFLPTVGILIFLVIETVKGVRRQRERDARRHGWSGDSSTPSA